MIQKNIPVKLDKKHECHFDLQETDKQTTESLHAKIVCVMKFQRHIQPRT